MTGIEVEYMGGGRCVGEGGGEGREKVVVVVVVYNQ